STIRAATRTTWRPAASTPESTRAMSYTLEETARYEEIIRKSRFLALAAPVRAANEAQAFFAAHHVPDATHNCWAYRIGQEYRFNDDGEPGGTAGRPILQAIDGQQ